MGVCGVWCVVRDGDKWGGDGERVNVCAGCGVVVFVHVFTCVVGTGTINQEMFMLKIFHM